MGWYVRAERKEGKRIANTEIVSSREEQASYINQKRQLWSERECGGWVGWRLIRAKKVVDLS